MLVVMANIEVNYEQVKIQKDVFGEFQVISTLELTPGVYP
jgi:hypothetical protein